MSFDLETEYRSEFLRPDLEIARDVQRAFVPQSAPSIPGFGVRKLLQTRPSYRRRPL
jgi:hypothetical protein